MRRLALSLSLMGCLVAPATSLALGLGSIEVQTTLNQPLMADIKLVGTSPSELQGLSVRLASPQLFQQVGISRPDYLDSLSFKVMSGDNGDYIQVTTPKAVNQPFLDFLVEVNWPGGRLLREYTILLNPPNYMQGKPEVAVSPPVQATSATPLTQQPVPTPQPTPTAPSVAAPTSAQTSAPKASSVGSTMSTAATTYRVKRGDVLSKVAEDMGKGQSVSLNQMMIALVRTNPEAFINGNINGLKQGYVLRMPASKTLESLGQTQATAEVQQQNSLWRTYAARMAGHTVAQSQLTQETKPSAPAATTASAAKTPAAGEKLKIMGTEPSSSSSSENAAPGAAVSDQQAAKLKHELALAQETAASNKQQISDLESRVKALQSIVDKQQKLIEIKNQTLASLQKQASVKPTAPSVAAVTMAPPTPSAVAKSTTMSKAPPVAAAVGGTTAVAPSTTVAKPVAVKPAETKAEVKPVQPKPVQHKPAVAHKPVIKPKPAATTSFIDDLMNNPTMLMGAGGVALLVLALLWLVARRSSKARGEKKKADVASTLGQGEPEFDAMDEFDDVLPAAEDMAGAEDVVEAVHPQEPPPAAPPPAAASSVNRSAIERAKAAEAADDVLAEADVYIAYGLFQQAEDLLQKALSASPGRHDYRSKLLECHFGAKNVSAFVSGAKSLYEDMDHPEVDPLWIRVATLGKELVPDNPLFTGTDTGDLTSADVMASEPASDDLSFGDSDFDLASASSGAEAAADDMGFDLGDLSDLGEAVGNEASPPASALDEPLEFDENLGPVTTETEVLNVKSPGIDEGLDLDMGMDMSMDELDISDASDALQEKGADDALSLDVGDLPEVGGAGEDFGAFDLDSDAFDLEDDVSKSGAITVEDDGFSIDDLPEPDTGISLEMTDADELGGLVGDDAAATNLDLAKAYIDMGDNEGARSALEEVVADGNDAQKKEAEALLSQLS